MLVKCQMQKIFLIQLQRQISNMHLYSSAHQSQNNKTSSVDSVDLLLTDGLGCVHICCCCSHRSFEVSLFLYDKQLLNFVGGAPAGWNFTMCLIHVVLYLKRQIETQPQHCDFC